MTWLVWRQHRTQTVMSGAVLAAFAVLILITGRQIAAQFHADAVACSAAQGCRWPTDNLALGSTLVNFVVELTLAVPALLGMFWGGPLIARELETGTSQFIWTQSVTRKRWLTATIGWMLFAALIWGGAVTALVTWWSGPKNAAFLNVFNPGTFDVQGIVPAAYSVFAMALGIAAGALIRRSVPALAVTLGGYFAVRLAIMGWIRAHYMSAVTTTYLVDQKYQPSGAFWQLSQGVVTPHGVLPPPNGSGAVALIGNVPLSQVPAVCQAGPHFAQEVIACLTSHGYRNFITYQPGSRFWAFQGIESGIFLALAAALVAFATVVVLRRDA